MRDERRGKKIHLISPYSLKGRSSPLSPIFSTKVGRMGARDFRISWMGEEEEEKRPFKCGRKREGLRRKRREEEERPLRKYLLIPFFPPLFFFQRLFEEDFPLCSLPLPPPPFAQISDSSLLFFFHRKKRREGLFPLPTPAPSFAAFLLPLLSLPRWNPTEKRTKNTKIVSNCSIVFL